MITVSLHREKYVYALIESVELCYVFWLVAEKKRVGKYQKNRVGHKSLSTEINP